jgi:hypothetical protein
VKARSLDELPIGQMGWLQSRIRLKIRGLPRL